MQSRSVQIFVSPSASRPVEPFEDSVPASEVAAGLACAPGAVSVESAAAVLYCPEQGRMSAIAQSNEVKTFFIISVTLFSGSGIFKNRTNIFLRIFKIKRD